MRMLIQNTKRKGNITIFGYKSGKKFISVCLELDIVKEGTKREVLTQEMIEAVKGHVETVCKAKLDETLLNRPAPEKYWRAYEKFLDSQKKSKVPRQAGSLNVLPIADLCRA